MIELHQFAPAWGINISPFCLKVETYLRLTNLNYRPIATIPQKSPTGKLPFIVDGAHTVADSSRIIQYLKGRYGDPLNHGLSAQQIKTGHLIRRLCEESLYFVFLYSRWIEEAGWRISAPAIFAPLPLVVREIGPYLVRWNVRRTLHRQGYGRHTRDELYRLGTDDVKTLAGVLGHKEFIVGDRPTSYDACMYGFLVNILRAPHDTPLKRTANALPELSAYLERIDARLAMRDPIDGSKRIASGPVARP